MCYEGGPDTSLYGQASPARYAINYDPRFIGTLIDYCRVYTKQKQKPHGVDCTPKILQKNTKDRVLFPGFAWYATIFQVPSKSGK